MYELHRTERPFNNSPSESGKPETAHVERQSMKVIAKKGCHVLQRCKPPVPSMT